MDLEHLNKTQTILLTLLVSFVTSIATGIATVSLMEKAPTDVTRVISRIVEKPIETFTGGKTIVEERTVLVNEGERVADAVEKAERSIVRLFTLSGKDDLEFLGLGVIISPEGVVVADSRIVDKKENYVAMLSDGTRVNAEPSDTQTEQGFFKLELPAELPLLVPATFASFDKLVLGQTVVALTGETSTRIAPGIIAELSPSTGSESSRLRAMIDTGTIVLGSPLIDLSGAIIGMPENQESQIFLSLRESAGE